MAPTAATELSGTESTAVIRELTSNVTIISVPFRHLGAEVGTRTTIARLPTTNSLLIYCPAALDDTIRAVVSSMGGAVKYLICGNMGHHLFIPNWAKAYPEASIIAPEGLRERRQKQKLEDVEFRYVVTENSSLPEEITQDVAVEYVSGSIVSEIVLYHKTDRVLLMTDLFMSLPAHEAYQNVEDRKPTGGLSSIFNSVGWDDRVHGKVALTIRYLLLWYVFGSKDRQAFIQSISHMYENWDMKYLVCCHGDVVEKEGEAKRIYECAFKWQLKAAKKEK